MSRNSRKPVIFNIRNTKSKEKKRILLTKSEAKAIHDNNWRKLRQLIDKLKKHGNIL